MGAIHKPTPVKLVVPMLSGQQELLSEAADILTTHLGPLDYQSGFIAWAHTTYYEAEMGIDLMRCFVAFERLIDPGQLAEIKVLTNTLEEHWAPGGKRKVNLDPGYLAQGKFVLATTKDHGHRIYLGQGIYAEVTLVYHGKGYETLPWTYPDYRTQAYGDILLEIRRRYSAQLDALRPAHHSTMM